MANQVAGLNPVQGQQESGSIQTKRRTPTDPHTIPNAPRFRPQAAPVSTYVRPEQPDLNNPATALASALEGINPAIAVITKKHKKDSYDKAVAFMGGKSHEEVMGAVRGGQAPQLENAVGQQLFGKRQAFWRAEQLKFVYSNEFDRDNGNLEELIKAAIDEDMSSYGDDKMFTTNYFEVLQPELDKLRLGHNDYRQERLMAQRKDQIFDVWYQGANTAFEDGQAPEDIVKGIYAGFQSNKDFQRLTIKEQQEMLLDLAERNINDGNFALAQEMLTQEHGSDGIKRSLVSDRDFGNEASRLLALSNAKQKKVVQTYHADVAEDQAQKTAFEALMGGTAASLTDTELPTSSGGTRTYSADQQRKDAANYFLQRMDEYSQKNGIAPEEQFNNELTVLSQNGIKHPRWEETLQTGAVAASGVTVANGGSLPPALKEGYSLYTNLRARNPRYLNSMLDDRSRQYYEAVRIGQDYLKLDLQGAHMNAVQATENAQSGKTPYHRYKITDLKQAVKKVEKKDLFLGMGTRLENGSDLADEVFSTAQYYIGLGLPPENALVEATSTISGIYTNVGGWAVKLGDYGLPQNTPELMGEMLDQYVTNHPDEELERDDLQVRPMGNGSGLWAIVNKVTQGAVEDRSAGQGIIRTQDILGLAQVQRDQQENEARMAADKASAERYTPWFANKHISVGPQKWGGFTDEEKLKIAEQRKRLTREYHKEIDAVSKLREEHQPPLTRGNNVLLQ